MARNAATHSGVTTFPFRDGQQHREVALRLLQDGHTWTELCPKFAHLFLTDAKVRERLYAVKVPKGVTPKP